jgi:hypothetical protein
MEAFGSICRQTAAFNPRSAVALQAFGRRAARGGGGTRRGGGLRCLEFAGCRVRRERVSKTALATRSGAEYERFADGHA